MSTSTETERAKSRSLGAWTADGGAPIFAPPAIREAFEAISEPLVLLRAEDGAWGVGRGGSWAPEAPGDAGSADETGNNRVRGYVPACLPENLGDSGFCRDLGIRYPYIAGAMANGLATVELVQAMGENGMIGFFGAAGLAPAQVEDAMDRLQAASSAASRPFPFGSNLIHSPAEPRLEDTIVDIYLDKGVRLLSASAFLRLSLPLIRYRVHGIHRDPDSGAIVAPNRVIAKISRVEIAQRFFAPPPEKFLKALVASGDITEAQAGLAAQIPVAEDLTAEADSGGHTDNRPFVTLIPTMLVLARQMEAKHGYERPLRIGAAGGIGTPHAVAAAFAMGASYVLTGSINQPCPESGTSDVVRDLLCQTKQADVAMAPAADMFEMGVKVQVLKRGTMFAMRGAKLYELYKNFGAMDEIPADQRAQVEKDLFHAPMAAIWEDTRAFFAERDPKQIEKAEADPKHKMALVFRWYLGQASRWANAGDPDRKIDYQIWCGPAMGSFNQWVKGSALEEPAARNVHVVARNLLLGAAVVTRLASANSQGARFASTVSNVEPFSPERLNLLLQ